jgi:beta-lactam-binding protein with PASTA domain/serine/threonine protein kinase
MNVEEIWNGWKVESLIGEGSFGKVYKIVREEFGYKYVSALKVITIPQTLSEVETIRNDGMTEENVTMYFQGMVQEIVQEFTLMSKLKGITNIVSYEDHAVVELDDRFGWEIYIRMELLTPLFKYWQEHTYSVRDVIQLGIDICQALEVCQKYNIIHRDIKPENIFVSDIGKYKLGDFGIARQLEKTSSGLSKKGTYAYMAPEVYKGQPYNSNVDIYSLGIVLYRFLNNNRTPFLPPFPQEIRYSDKENANIMRISGENMEPPCNAKGRLSEIILKACAYDPKERYESAAEMKNALQTVLFDEDEAAFIYPEENLMLNGVTLTSAGSKKTTFSKMENHSVNNLNENDSKNEISGEKYSNNIEIEKTGSDNTDNDGTTILLMEEEIKSDDDRTTIMLTEEEIKSDDDRTTILLTGEEIKSDNELYDMLKISETEIVQEENDVDESDNSQQLKQVENKGKRKKLIAAAAIGCIVVAACIGVPKYYSMQQRTIPSVLNLSLEDADEVLSDMELNISVTAEEYSDSIKEGHIISQNLGEGEKVKKNTTLEVVISKGEQIKEPVYITVPKLTGLTKKEVQQLVQQNGLQADYVKEYSDVVEKGYVISQEPKAETEVEADTSVTIVISKGMEPIEIPSVVGKTIEGAKEALESKSLICEVKNIYSDSVEEGYVISQNINAGEKVVKDTTITITVSLGNEPGEDQSVHNSSKSSSSSSKSSSSSSKSSSSSSKSSSSSSKSSSSSSKSSSSSSKSSSSSSKSSSSTSGESSSKSSSGGNSSENKVETDFDIDF